MQRCPPITLMGDTIPEVVIIRMAGQYRECAVSKQKLIDALKLIEQRNQP